MGLSFVFALKACGLGSLQASYQDEKNAPRQALSAPPVRFERLNAS